MIDIPFLLAAGAVGWGLSLVLYRPIARLSGWPLGALHVDFPALPMLIGIVAIAIGLNFAAVRGTAGGAGEIIVFAVLLAVFWIGFLRVGSQSSLILAPLASILLLVSWSAKH